MINIAIIGHIDHGKSTLIGRLLYDTNSLPEGKIDEIKKTCEELGLDFEFAHVVDALEEERKKGMTIDTTQIFFKYKGKEFAIIDAPGHKEFIKNMVTGVSQADIAILIVDVKEGIKEQTKRHAYFAKLLGIDKVIVVINKMDLVNYSKEEYEKVKEEVIKYLDEIELNYEFILPISAYTGENIVKNTKLNWYNGPTLLDILYNLKKDEKNYDFRFIIQDVYDKNGKKIHLGNILSGEIKVGEKVKVNDIETIVKEILDGMKSVNSAKSPKAVGLVLNKIFERGNVIYKGNTPLIKNEIEGLIFSFEKIKKGDECDIKIMTEEAKGKIEEIWEVIDIDNLEKKNSDIINELEVGKVKLKLDKRLVFENFNKLKELGRFVLLKEGKIIGGGIIS